MRKLLRYVLAACMSLSFFMANTVDAQSYPFPVNYKYTYGIMPTNYDNSDVQAAYDYWKTNFVTTGCGARRVIFDYYPGTGRGATDRSATVSEGIGYGMLIAAYMGDRAMFDDFWAFYKRHRNGNGVMHWQIRDCGVYGQNGATDAEFDVAMALIVASYQWQSDDYVNDARNMIRIIREKEFDGLIMKPGDQFGGANLTCPSYFSPGYYRVFKDYDPGYEQFWDDAAKKGYEIIELAGGSTGLVPDWCTAQGTESSAAGQYEDDGKNFIFDAIRTPFRSGIDYIWHGNEDAEAYCEKISKWLLDAHSSPELIGGKYGTAVNNNEGAKIASYQNNTFVGCFSVGLMGSSDDRAQNFLDRAYSANVNQTPGYGEYFNASFKILSLLVLTGNFYLPPPDACDAPELGEDRSLCEGSPIELNAGISVANYQWKRNGVVQSGNSQSLSASEPGIYEVITTTTEGCVRRDKVNVFAAELNADFIATQGAGFIGVESTTTGGVSSYSYSISSEGGAAEEFATEANGQTSNLEAGVYDITLTVSNDGFPGCSATDEITKSVPFGDGEGIAVDDFVEANSRQVYAYTFGAGLEAIEKTYCSRDDEIAGAEPVCPVFPCGYAEIKTDNTPVADREDYAAVGVGWGANADAPFDLSSTPYMSIRMWASSDVSVGTKLQMGEFSNNSVMVDLTTEPQVFTIDFSEALTGWDNTLSETVTIDAWDAVTAMQILPFADDIEFSGSIYIDWFIVGAKTLPKPSFATLLDEYGYTDYGAYRPDFFPGDPTYADCTPSSEGEPCYGAVPDWQRNIRLCEAGTEITANSCTATEIKWYKGNTYLGSGENLAVESSGLYFVELINEGGIYRDSVNVVAGSEPEAEFIFAIEDQGYGYRFYNNSTGFDTWEWDYDYTSSNPDLAGSETWEEGYMYYDEEGEYEVCLTINDTTCGNTDQLCQTITVECSAPMDEIVGLPSTTIEACPGEVISAAIQEVENASSYGWYGWTTAPLAEDETAITFEAEVPFWLKVEAYNQCEEKVVDSVYVNVGLKPEITWDTFEADGYAGTFVHSTTGYPVEGTEDFTWTIDGVEITDYANQYGISHTFETAGSHEVCVIAGYDCEAESGEVKSCDIIEIECPLPTEPAYTSTNDQLAYAFTNSTMEADVEYTWLVDGNEVDAEADGSLAFEFDAEGEYNVCLIAGNACVLPGTDAPQNCKTITASLSCETTPSLDFTRSIAGFDATITPTYENVENLAWTVDAEEYTPTEEPFTITFEEGSHEICVTATASGEGCADPAEVCKAVEIIDNCEAPLISFVPTENNGEVTITTTSNASTYSWTATGSEEVTSEEKSPVFTYTTDGTYTIEVEAMSACGKSAMATEDVEVSICQEVEADFTYTSSGLEVTITNRSTNATSYTWSTDEEANVSTEENPVITFANLGEEKSITLSAASDCDADTKIVDLSLTGGDCETPDLAINVVDNNDQTLSVTGSTSETNATYEWQAFGLWFQDETSVSTTANFDSPITDDTEVTIELTVTNDCGASNTIDTTLTVSAGPSCDEPATADFSATATDGVVTITNNSENAGSYTWTATGSEETSSTVETPTFTYSANGTYTINLEVTSTDADCDNDDTSIEVVVDDLPECVTPATADFTATNVEGVVTIVNNSTNAASYSWTATDSEEGSSDIETPTFTYSTNGSYTIELTVESEDENCPNATTEETVSVDDISTSVECEQPVADFDFSISGLTMNVTENSSTGDITAYSWTQDGTEFSTAETPSFQFAANGTYEVCLALTAQTAGCTNTITDDEICQDVTVEVTTDDCPNKPDLGEDRSLCDGDVTLSVPSTTTGSIRWWIAGSDSPMMVSGNSYNVDAPGEYVVAIDATCFDTVMVYGVADVNAGFTGDINDLSGVFTADVVGASSSDAYSWTVSGIEEGQTSTFNHNFEAEGTYNVCLTVQNECGATNRKCAPVEVAEGTSSTVTVDPLGTGIEELIASGLINIYPTLVSDVVNIEVVDGLGDVQVIVTNLMGSTLTQTTISATSTIDLSNLSVGVYLITVITDQGMGTIKVTKE